MNADVLTPPAGFVPFERPSPLIDPWRPIFCLPRKDRLVLGLFIERRHTNSRGTAHGGLIAGLADWAMGLSCGAKMTAEGTAFETFWTASLTVDYLGKAVEGQWLTFDTDFIKTGRTLCHTECDVAADRETVARARGAFRVQAPHVSSSS